MNKSTQDEGPRARKPEGEFGVLPNRPNTPIFYFSPTITHKAVVERMITLSRQKPDMQLIYQLGEEVDFSDAFNSAFLDPPPTDVNGMPPSRREQR